MKFISEDEKELIDLVLKRLSNRINYFRDKLNGDVTADELEAFLKDNKLENYERI